MNSPERLRNEAREVVKGATEQVIRVRAPVQGIFREAIFFLEEDYLRRGERRKEELMREARRAAELYTSACLPERERSRRWLYPLLFLGGAALGLGLGILM